MENLQVGMQLMVVGLTLVFLVLVLLMYMMKLLSVLIQKTDSTPAPQPVVTAEPNTADEELAVVFAVITGLLEEVKGPEIQIKVSEVK